MTRSMLSIPAVLTPAAAAVAFPATRDGVRLFRCELVTACVTAGGDIGGSALIPGRTRAIVQLRRDPPRTPRS